MAIYDRQANKIVVRIAYDGPARAGKTTNIEQVAELFPIERRTGLQRSEESAGQRTLFLDWMQVDSGLVQGHELRCQLLTVPGQAVLTRRRRLLLELADAVVFVTDASPENISSTSRMWRELLTLFDEHDRERIPVVIQINKQDLGSGLSEDELRRELNCSRTTPIVRAEAARGVGVRESLVLAVRAATYRVQRTLESRGLDALTGSAVGPEQIRAMIDAEEQTAPLEPVELLRGRNQLWAPRSPDPRSSDESSAVEPAEVLSAGDLNEDTPPELPPASAPPGMVWPATKGRSILRRIPRETAELRAQPGREPGSTGGRFWTFEAGLWCLRTAQLRCYPTADAAAAELRLCARFQAQLGPLLPPQSALCVHRSGAPVRFRVWSIAPWLSTVRTLLAFAHERGDTAELGRVLCAYADAVLDATFALAEPGLLDLDPEYFGWLNGQCCYLRDRVCTDTRASNPVSALSDRFGELLDVPSAVEQCLAHVSEKIAALSVPQRQQLSVFAQALEGTRPNVGQSFSRLFSAEAG